MGRRQEMFVGHIPTATDIPSREPTSLTASTKLVRALIVQCTREDITVAEAIGCLREESHSSFTTGRAIKVLGVIGNHLFYDSRIGKDYPTAIELIAITIEGLVIPIGITKFLS